MTGFNGGLIPEDSTLVLDGDICLENVNMDTGAALVFHAAKRLRHNRRSAFSTKPTFEIQELSDSRSPNAPEYLRIRGYLIADQGAKKQIIFQPGQWIIIPQGEVFSA